MIIQEFHSYEVKEKIGEVNEVSASLEVKDVCHAMCNSIVDNSDNFNNSEQSDNFQIILLYEDRH